jgi:3-oxoacyl-[acyl-carrier protein] reductase
MVRPCSRSLIGLEYSLAAEGRGGAVNIAGRVALITGGGTGLGRATALELAGAGAHVAVNYSQSRKAAEAVAQEISDGETSGLTVQGDVSDPAAVQAMIHILMNNAGTTKYAPDLSTVTVEHWERIFRVNVLGAFLCAQAVADGMKERGVGRILNVASNSAYSAAGSSLPYVVSKAAVVSLTQALAKELAPDVNVNAVAPGWMLTEWVDRHLPPDKAAELRSGAIAVVPVEDVARSAIEMIANDSITGQVVVIDNGEMWQ